MFLCNSSLCLFLSHTRARANMIKKNKLWDISSDESVNVSSTTYVLMFDSDDVDQAWVVERRSSQPPLQYVYIF